ncbi:MAG: hypothetical protein EOM66_12415 [Clostridia bacterium]|nr:hypothetical protein [Clostridia bacterium]
MNSKKLITLLAASLVFILVLTGCKAAEPAVQEPAAAAPVAEAAQEAAGEPVTITLGVVGSIYEELWAPAKETLKAEGINLEFVQFSDYVTPNNALANGETDLNSFQHRIYLADEVENHGYKIEVIGNTFIIPLNLYSTKVQSVDEIQDGDTIAIPNDVTNGGRALKVLDAHQRKPSQRWRAHSWPMADMPR